MKNCILSFCLSICLAACADGFPQPWAWWVPADAYDPATSGNIDYYERVADHTGNGHVLTTTGSGGISILTNDVMRGKCWLTSGTGGAFAMFDCPAMQSRTFSIWVNSESATNGYAENDASPLYLLYNLSGLSITSPWGNSPVWTVNGLAATSLTWAAIPYIWNHLVVTVADTGARAGAHALCTVKLYVNGDCVGTQDDVAVPVVSGTAVIANNGSWVKHDPKSLRFDDVRVWTNALSAAEVVAVFKDGRKQKMIGHWPCDRIDVAEDGTRTTPDISGMGAPLKIEALNSLTNGIDGTPALFFGAGPQTAEQEAYESMATATNTFGSNLVGDWTWAFWYKPDRLQNTLNGARLCLFDGRHLMLGYLTNGNGIQIGDGASVWGGGDTITLSNWRPEEWAHLVFSCRYDRQRQQDGTYVNVGYFVVYQNGERVFTGTPKNSNAYGFMPYPGSFYIGNFVGGNANDFRRPIRGTMDDIRLYMGRLTDDEVRALYQGPAAVKAGEDFAVTGETAELHGEVSYSPMTRAATGYAGEPMWTLVSAPEGGEGAVIANPKGACTRVTLPVEGAYVFALSNNVLNKVCVDEVTVTRRASPAESVPTVTAVMTSQTGLCAVVSATVNDGARVRWSKASGPGMASFGQVNAAKTGVTFSQAGTYTLACTAETDAGRAVAEVTVVAEGDSIDELLRQGLGCYWPFKIEQGKSQVDEVAELKLNVNYPDKLMFVADGVADGYAVNLGPGTASGLATANGSYAPWAEYLTSDTSSGGTPKEPFNTISCWLYHDSACTWPCWMGTVCYASYSCGIHYLCDNGEANDFALVQNKTQNQYQQRYRGPTGLNYTNRWIHFVAQLDNHGKGLSEVWVNGIRLEQMTSVTMGAGRTCNAFSWGGQSCYGYPPNDPNVSRADVTNKNFPGRIDELRMYRRHLSEAEIRYLYEHPVPSAVNDAPVIEVPVAPALLVTKRADGVAQVASADDGRPNGRLTYRWQVLEGDAANLVFSDVVDARPTVTALKSGAYTLQLVVGDGVRTTYSDPIPVTAVAAGTVFLMR